MQKIFLPNIFLLLAIALAAVGCGGNEDTKFKKLNSMGAVVRLHQGKVSGVTINQSSGIKFSRFVPELRGLSDLKKLSVSRIDNEDLKSIGEFTSLEALIIPASSVDGDGLEQLSKLTGLRNLDLSGTNVTDQCLKKLRHFSKLETLKLSSTGVSDAGLAELESLTSLRQLYLNKTRITDAGLKHLHSLELISDLAVHGTKVTDKGFEELKKHLPKLKHGR